jgi:hypothetical protein
MSARCVVHKGFAPDRVYSIIGMGKMQSHEPFLEAFDTTGGVEQESEWKRLIDTLFDLRNESTLKLSEDYHRGQYHAYTKAMKVVQDLYNEGKNK